MILALWREGQWTGIYRIRPAFLRSLPLLSPHLQNSNWCLGLFFLSICSISETAPTRRLSQRAETHIKW